MPVEEFGGSRVAADLFVPKQRNFSLPAVSYTKVWIASQGGLPELLARIQKLLIFQVYTSPYLANSRRKEACPVPSAMVRCVDSA